MIELFNEINELPNIDTTFSICKKKILNKISITKEQIKINENIRNELIELNQCCLNHLYEENNVIQQKGYDLFLQKNKDYGDSYLLCGLIGILIRILDKINRIKQITINGSIEVKDEKYEDTILDLHNYTLLGILCIDEL